MIGSFKMKYVNRLAHKNLNNYKISIITEKLHHRNCLLKRLKLCKSLQVRAMAK